MNMVEKEKVLLQENDFHINYLHTVPGVLINGKTYWIKDSCERLLNEAGVSIQIDYDFKGSVGSQQSKVSFHDIYIKNHDMDEKKLNFLMMHYHSNPLADQFSFVSPTEKVIYHISDDMIYLVNGIYHGVSINHCTIQSQWNIQNDNFWENQENGILQYRPMMKGLPASIFSFQLKLSAGETNKCSSWTAFGKDKSELIQINDTFLKSY